MTRIRWSVLLGAAAVAISAGAGALQAQAASQDALVKRGKSVWQNRGCASCHAIGKVMAGPDLANVTGRRSKDWLSRWLKDTAGMLGSDSTAQALLAEWKGMKMPAQKLTDQDVDAVLAYIDAETAKIRK